MPIPSSSWAEAVAEMHQCVEDPGTVILVNFDAVNSDGPIRKALSNALIKFSSVITLNNDAQYPYPVAYLPKENSQDQALAVQNELRIRLDCDNLVVVIRE